MNPFRHRQEPFRPFIGGCRVPPSGAGGTSPFGPVLPAAFAALLALAVAAPGGRGALADAPLRVPNTSLALPPSLPAGTFGTADAFPGILFSDPLAFATPPGESRRLFVAEQTGRISLIPDPAAPARETFLDISARVRTSNNEEGLLGLAFHPRYHVAGSPGQGRFFVCYMATINNQRHWRLSRFSVRADDPDRGDPDSEVLLITQRDFASNHNGGDLHFGEDGYLYVSTGDEGGGSDQYDHGQRIDKSFFASVLRLDVDLREGSLEPNPHPAVHPGAYRVPADNPFVGATHFNGLPVVAAGVRTEIWAIGLRNPWRMSFDRPTGRLFVADVGQSAREEINILSPEAFATNGGVPNYGWSFREGKAAFGSGPGGATPPAGFSAIEPIHDYVRSQGHSITGGLVYRGSRYPELAGAYLFADYVSGRIWAMADPGGPGQAVEEIASRAQIAAFGLDPVTGDVLLARDNSNRAVDDPVYRLVRAPAGGAEPPALLSQTGAFQSLATLEPEPGIVPYEINAPFWSDHALKRRWFSIPDPEARMAWSEDGHWGFPAGQVWIKHFELDLDRDAPGSQRVRLETRFLVKTGDGVYGITYRWNEAQTEAFLVGEEGESGEFSVVEGGAARSQTWRFPSRSDCRTCHNPGAGWALGFNTRQLNRSVDHDHGGGGPLDQLAALADAGYFENAVPPSAGLPAHAPPQDPAFPLEARARAYLATNCAACHQSGSVGMGGWSASPELSLAESGLLDSPLLNNAGDPHKRTLVPGDPERSMILERLRAPRSGAGPLAPMPPLASHEIDEEGIALLEEWLLSLRKVLFVRGADRSGGFLSAGDDAQRSEQLSDIENHAAGSPNHGWGQLAEALRGEGFLVEQVKEGAETQSGPSQGIPVPFEEMNLAQYRVVVFGSNNAVYGQPAVDAVDAWIRGGGAALFVSDANFGGDWADAADSDQQFLDRFGLVMNQDQGTYARSRASGHFALPEHPVFAGVESFDGEGVSPLSLGATPPDVSAAVAATAQGQVRRNEAPFGANRLGPSTAATADDAALLLAEAGEGRIAGHFDRNTFFNEGGVGSDLTRHDNLRYALNLFEWLAEGSPPDPAPEDLTASGGLHLDRVALAWTGVEGAELHTVYRGAGEDFAGAEPVGTSDTEQYDDLGTEPGAVWSYWVTAALDGTETAPAGPAAGWRAVPPPAGLAASDATRSDRVEIAWEAVEGAGYRLYRGTGTDFAAAALHHATGGLSYDDGAGATVAGLVYRYWVAALRNGTESAPAGPATGRRALIPPGEPEASVDGAENGVALGWSASPDATLYRILRHGSDDFASAVEVGSTSSTSWLDASAEPGTDYRYWIVAGNAHGESGPTAGAAGRRLLVLRQPDLMIGRSPAQRLGEGLFQGAPGQTLRMASRRRRPLAAHFLLRNAGTLPDSYRLFATRETAFFSVAYFSTEPLAANITAAATGGAHFTAPLESAESERGRIRVRPSARLRRDRRVRSIALTLWATSSAEPARNDRVVLRATSRR